MSQWIWTEARMAEARRLYIDQGHSAAKTAMAIGAVSRNAVIGLAHRRGWMRDHRQKPTVTGKASARAVSQDRADPPPARAAPLTGAVSRPSLGIAGNGVVFERAQCPPPRAVVDYPEEPAGSVTILTAKANHCRWPIGEGAGLTFCGKLRRDESVSYCPDHCAVAFQGQVAANGRRIPNTRELERSLRRFTA